MHHAYDIIKGFTWVLTETRIEKSLEETKDNILNIYIEEKRPKVVVTVFTVVTIFLHM